MTVTLILLALKSLLVAAVTLGLLRLTHRRSASERSTIAHLGLFALVALPLGSLALPTLALPVPIAGLTAIDPVVNPQPALPVSGRATPAFRTSATASAAPEQVASA
jgi:bla regulator protein blaR1